MSGGYRNLTGAASLVSLLYKLNVVDQPTKFLAHTCILSVALSVHIRKRNNVE